LAHYKKINQPHYTFHSIFTGPAGLSALHKFTQATILLDDSITKKLEIVCFEKQTGLVGQLYDAK
jgi:hypothetical protein